MAPVTQGSSGLEIGVKTARLARLARGADLGGILLATQRNFSWLTGGATNRIDINRDLGAGLLFVTADERRFAIANTIEMPRLVDEVLVGLDVEPLQYEWTAEQADASTVATLARSVLTSNARIGADAPLPDTIQVEPSIARVRAPLTDEEVTRYRALGHDVGVAFGDVCRELTPGQTEAGIAAAAAAAVGRVGAQAVVTLVGADDRIARYRHPVPGPTRWARLVLIALCAERHGLVVSLSRLISVGPVPDALAARTRATARVFGSLLSATRPGATGASIFQAAVEAYASEGFPAEETRHHQGGAIGYRTREWLAHPRSTEEVHAPQAFAWNPTITGTKVEDTALVTSAGVEIVTSSPGWPSLEINVGDQTLLASDILEI